MSVILICNAGSNNTKLAALDSETLELKGHMLARDSAQAIEWMCSIGELGIAAVGHRIVHGGRGFTHPEIVNDDVVKTLEIYTRLAPLHQPVGLKLMQEARKLYPNVPHISCFDTAFRHTMPEIERRLPIPDWCHQQGIHRYGFHGLSYQHIANVLPNYAGEKADGRVIAVHLGGGASACAMKDRKSIASTMGFSTLDGLMMSTRTGGDTSGVILHLLEELEMKKDEVDRLLYLESGLLGVSGISSDMRDLLSSPKPEASRAIALYCYLAAKQIAALLPAIGGLDVLVFTGGIGENARPVREQIVGLLRWLGDFPVHVIPANEELVIARACQAIL